MLLYNHGSKTAIGNVPPVQPRVIWHATIPMISDASFQLRTVYYSDLFVVAKSAFNRKVVRLFTRQQYNTFEEVFSFNSAHCWRCNWLITIKCLGFRHKSEYVSKTERKERNRGMNGGASSSVCASSILTILWEYLSQPSLSKRMHYQCKSKVLLPWLFVGRILANRFEYVRRAKCRAQPSLDTSALNIGSPFLAPLSRRPSFYSRLGAGWEHSHNFSRLDARPFLTGPADEL